MTTEWRDNSEPGHLRPNCGMTSVSAARWLQSAFPGEAGWFSWQPGWGSAGAGLRRLPVGRLAEGWVRGWHWRFIATDYPNLMFSQALPADVPVEPGWTGAIRVTAPGGPSFLLFSFLSVDGTVGMRYLASVRDEKLLARFAKAAGGRCGRRRELRVHCVNGRDTVIDPASMPAAFLPPPEAAEIEREIETFFANRQLYRNLGVPHRRGFLFVGPPGNGKTLMIRHLLLRIWERQRRRAHFVTLVPRQDVDETEIDMLLKRASPARHTVIVLEDIDTLATETLLTRASLLNRLDGLEAASGILLLATTNNPEKIDPALLHRPSRFDRVWHFGLPGGDARRAYLAQAFPAVEPAVLGDITAGTAGWSFAYLNELRVTAGMLAAAAGESQVGAPGLRDAHARLAAQFSAGRRNHVCPAPPNVGFAAA